MKKIKLFETDPKQSVTVVRDPSQLLIVRIALVIFFIVSIVVAFFVGEYWSSVAASQRDKLLVEKKELTKALKEEQRMVAVLKMDMEVGSIALEEVRQINKELQDKVSGLEEEVAYYNRVMNPIKNDRGLRIDTVEIMETSDKDRFRFNIILTQLGQKNRSVIKGGVKVLLSGSVQGEKREFDLADLQLSDADLAFKFRFRYYQEIDGEFRLPEGFLPEQIEVYAQSVGSKAMKVDKVLPWTSTRS